MMTTVAAAAAPTAVQNHQRWKTEGCSGAWVWKSSAGLAGAGVLELAGGGAWDSGGNAAALAFSTAAVDS